MTATYVVADRGAPVRTSGKWLSPAAQPRGREWIYDVFTPPEIFYDKDRQQFVASRPHAQAAPEAAAQGLELVAVRRMPFRMQLVGFVVGGDRYLGTFEDQQTGEVILAGAGRKVPTLGLVITDFAVERRPVALADAQNSNQWVATAIVRDERSGESTRLVTGERAFTNELRAWLAADGDEDETLRELRAGEEFQGGKQSYIVERLQLEPPAAELAEIASPDASSTVRFSLTPRMSLESLATKPAN